VTVFVSTGPQQAEVPSVVGMMQADAEAAIRAAGLEPRVITQESTRGNAGRVIAQDQPPGSMVDLDSTVVIVVGEFTETSTTTGGRGGGTTSTTS
jgi:serine/threonine-protein kinase